jgi:hypothetical protein
MKRATIGWVLHKISPATTRRWAIAGLIFLLLSWLHMGPSLTDCSNTVLSGPGDHTAGLLYTSWINPSSPFQGTSNLTNFPYGEDLSQPTAITSVLPTSAHLALARFTGTTCGWNILILVSYMANSLLMFGFIRWLKKDTYIAYFAAYAVTFTPYHAFASQGQPAGLFGILYLLILWQFIALCKKPNFIKALSLGLLFGTSYYTDGYFILFSGVTLLAFWIALVSYSLMVHRNILIIKNQIRGLLLASILAILFLLPIGWIQHSQSEKIESYLTNVRGELNFEAQKFSASPYMYIVPTVNFPFVGEHIQGIQKKLFNDDSKPGLIFLGYSVIALSVVGLHSIWKDYRIKKASAKGLNQELLVGWTLVILAILAFWFSLKPNAMLFGAQINNPSSFIITLTPAWRVFGRLYAIVDIAMVILASIGLYRITLRYPAKKFVFFGLVMLILIFELRAFPATNSTDAFNYSDSPAVYSWLKTQPDIRGIAEYPLDEPPQGKFLADYYTFQTISGKPILNSFIPNSPQSGLRRSIAGINDPQTIPVLRALGIDLVNIRQTDQESNRSNELESIFSHTTSKHPFDSFLVKDGKVASYALIIPTLKYYQLKISTDGTAKFLIGNNTNLLVLKLPTQTVNSEPQTVSFSISADTNRQASIIQNGSVLWSGVIDQSVKPIEMKALVGVPITIITQESPQEIAHITLSNLRVIE